MDVINNQLQASHSKAGYICLEKMLLEGKHVSDFKQVLKEIDFREGLISINIIVKNSNL